MCSGNTPQGPASGCRWNFKQLILKASESLGMMACFYFTVQYWGTPSMAVTLVFDVIKWTSIETQNAVALKLKFNTAGANYL